MKGNKDGNGNGNEHRDDVDEVAGGRDRVSKSRVTGLTVNLTGI